MAGKSATNQRRRAARRSPTNRLKTSAGSHDYNHQAIFTILSTVADGGLSPQQALEKLRDLSGETLEFATLDHHRVLRKGFPEVVFCQDKTCRQVADIVERLAARGPRVLGTRASPEQYAAARRRTPGLKYHPLARALWMNRHGPAEREGVVVVAAGTTDIPVAEEAALTLELMGHKPLRIWDVGVAGLQRLLARLPELRQARTIVAVAGMDGALPGALAGLVAAPVIAAPTSIGYGTAFKGLAPLLTMLNSCSPGVAVVNIDNGFGAGYLAAMINGQAEPAQKGR